MLDVQPRADRLRAPSGGGRRGRGRCLPAAREPYKGATVIPDIHGEIPADFDAASLERCLPPLPAHLSGRPTKWSIRARDSLVSLGWTADGLSGGEPRSLWFLGYSCPTAVSGLDQSTPRGVAVPEIIVAYMKDGVCVTSVSLVQWNSLTFQQSDERNDSIPLRSVPRSFLKSQIALPRWSRKLSAEWPTHSGVPMDFVLQMRTPRKSPIHHLFVDGVDIFAFQRRTTSALHIKCIMLDYALQTASEHYREEAHRNG